MIPLCDYGAFRGWESRCDTSFSGGFWRCLGSSSGVSVVFEAGHGDGSGSKMV